MTLHDIARSQVVTASPTTVLSTIAERMREHDVGSVVVTEGDTPVGVVTDRDIGIGVWEHADPSAATAEDVMTPDPVTVDVETDVYTALQTAQEADVRRLPVTDDESLVGIVTLDDVIVLLAGELQQVSRVIQAHSPPY